jgi:hypothetical protein
MTHTKHQLSSHAVGKKSSGGSVPLQPVSTKVHSSPQRDGATKPNIKLTPPKK